MWWTICFIFLLQDPTSALLQLAEQSGMAQRFHALSLGQGQAPIATRMIKEGVREVSMDNYIQLYHTLFSSTVLADTKLKWIQTISCKINIKDPSYIYIYILYANLLFSLFTICQLNYRFKCPFIQQASSKIS